MSTPCAVQYVDHVGIAVRDLEASMKLFSELFGVAAGEVAELPDQGVRATLLAAGQTRLELLEPLSPDTAVGRFLERHGEGLHHLALHVEGIADKLKGLEANGVQLADRQPREGLSGIIAFIHPKSVHGILTELVETP